MYSFVIQPSVYLWPVTYYGSQGVDVIVGRSIVENTIYSFGGNDWIYGNVGNDWFFAGYGDDQIWGYAGSDVCWGEEGDDSIDGGAGDDFLYGGDGYDTLLGGDGDDVIHGNNDGDLIIGGAGRDMLYGDSGNDDIYLGDWSFGEAHGGDGNDKLFGGAGFNFLYGEDGDDEIHGGDSSDWIVGGSGVDHLYGNGGNDLITVGSGITVAEGGKGDDTFYLNLNNINTTFQLDGGEGHDVLEIDYFFPTEQGVDLPLSALGPRVQSIEELNLHYLVPIADLHVNAADVLDFTETGTLQIDGGANDTVHLEGGNWQAGAKEQINGVTFNDYFAASGDHTVKVQVEAAVHVEIA